MGKVTEAVEDTTVENTVVEKPYTLRELCDEDIYPMVNILDKTLPSDIKNAFRQVIEGNGSIDTVGGMVFVDIVRMVIKNIGKAKEEIYSFLSDVSGIPEDQLKKMPFGTTPRMIKDLFTMAKNSDFFTEVFKSLW